VPASLKASAITSTVVDIHDPFKRMLPAPLSSACIMSTSNQSIDSPHKRYL
jgi:hypothetical protein